MTPATLPRPATARPLALAAYATFALGVAAVCGTAAVTHSGTGGDTPLVPGLTLSQTGRQFAPAVLEVEVGDTVTIVNDDGTTVHHAYIPDEGMDFDSGDQEPGSRTDVTFTRAGAFRVLCGIHPRMQSFVHVRQGTTPPQP